MKILSFTCNVERIRYLTIKSTMKQNEGELVYVCNIYARETGRGYGRFKQYHNVIIYLTQEQFEKRDEETKIQNFIEKNDVLVIKDTAKWRNKLFTFNSWSPEKIKNAPKSMLKVDEKGNVYRQEVIHAYKVVCKDGDYEIKNKWYEKYYCTIKQSRIRLPLGEERQMKEPKLDWFLDTHEMTIMGQYNNEVVEVLFYKNQGFYFSREMSVKITSNAENGTNYLVLEDTTIKEETGENEKV